MKNLFQILIPITAMTACLLGGAMLCKHTQQLVYQRGYYQGYADSMDKTNAAEVKFVIDFFRECNNGIDPTLIFKDERGYILTIPCSAQYPDGLMLNDDPVEDSIPPLGDYSPDSHAAEIISVIK